MNEHLTLSQLKRYSFRKIERLQNLRLRAVCKHILPATPFYRSLFEAYGVAFNSIRTIEDWHMQGLPLIKKSAYLKRPQDFVVQPDKAHVFSSHLSYLLSLEEYRSALDLILLPNKRELLKQYYQPKMLIFSGGTETGNPTPALLTPQQKFNTLGGVLGIIGELLLSRFGTTQTTGMNVFPYAPHLGWHAVHQALDMHADLNLNTAAGGAMPTERLVKLAGKTKPNIICGMNEYLRNRFLPLAIKENIKLPETVLFINGAQKMIDAERRQIEELSKKLGVTNPIVLDFYGASELKTALMPECQSGSGFHHIAPLSSIVDTVTAKPSGKDIIDNWDFAVNGYGVTWNIDGAGTMLSGYFLGDVFERVENSQCPHCKLNVKRIFEVSRIRDVQAQIGLTGAVEAKLKGAKINLAAYREEALSVKEVKEVQVVLRGKTLELRFVADNPSRAKKELETLFKSAEIKPKLVPTTYEKLKGDKLKYEPIKP